MNNKKTRFSLLLLIIMLWLSGTQLFGYIQTPKGKIEWSPKITKGSDIDVGLGIGLAYGLTDHWEFNVGHDYTKSTITSTYRFFGRDFTFTNEIESNITSISVVRRVDIPHAALRIGYAYHMGSQETLDISGRSLSIQYILDTEGIKPYVAKSWSQLTVEDETQNTDHFTYGAYLETSHRSNIFIALDNQSDAVSAGIMWYH